MPRKGIASSDLHISMFWLFIRILRLFYSHFRFRVRVVAYDQTGKLDVILSDREVYSLIGCRARDVIPEVKYTFSFR